MIQARAIQATNTILHEPVPDRFVKERILVSIYLKKEKKRFFRTGKNGEFLYGYFCLSDSPPEAVGPRKFGPHRGQPY